MATVWELTKTALTALGVPMAANTYQAVSGVDNLPDLYLVYFAVSAAPRQHAEDAETLRTWRVQVSVYNRAGLTSLPDVKGQMVAAGFTRGPARELAYDIVTRHYGLALDFFYLEEQ